MITEIDDYFAKGCGRCARFETPDCAVQHFAHGLADLRRICLDLGLVEAVKWGHPCYMHNGSNIAIVGAFRDNFRMTFMNGSLLKDAGKVLRTAGPNSRTANVLFFQSDDDVATLEPVIRAYLTELMQYARDGIKPAQTDHGDMDLANELVTAMDTDPELAEGFHALTRGRQHGWNLHFTSAKQTATRATRIAKARDKIIAGKGWNER